MAAPELGRLHTRSRRHPWLESLTSSGNAYEDKPLTELVDAPVEALQGVSPGDAEHLKAAFNIKTIGDLGRNKYFLWAQSIAKLAE